MVLERFVNTSFFKVSFVVSFMMLMFSQLVVIPILLFLFLFIVYLKRFRESFSLEDILFYVFILFSSIPILVAKNKEVAIGGVLILILYYIVFYVGRNFNIRVGLFFVSISLGFVILALFGVVFYVFPNLSLLVRLGNINLIEIPPPLTFLNDNVVRSNSITPSPVLYSSAVLYSIPLLVSMVLWLYRNSSKTFFEKLLLALTIFLIGVVTFTSGSRSIFFLAPIGFALVLLMFRKYKELLVFVVLFTLATVLILSYSPLSQRIESAVKMTDTSSLVNRFDSYEMSLEILFLKNWLIGVGLVNFKEYVPSYYGNYIHNIYLSILVETGVLGFAAFIALISVILYKAFRNVFNKKIFDIFRGIFDTFKDIFKAIGNILNRGIFDTFKDIFDSFVNIFNKNIFSNVSDYLKVGAFVSVICFLIHGIIDNTLYVVPLGIMFWFFLGLSCNKTISTDEKLERDAGENLDSVKS